MKNTAFLLFLAVSLIGGGRHAFAVHAPLQEPRNNIEPGPLTPEMELNLVIWAVGYNQSSVEGAKKAIPGLVLKAKLFDAKNVDKHIPEDVQKEPGGDLAKRYYEDWGKSMFINPWDIHSATGNWDPEVFYFVTSNGTMVKGKLPKGLPKDKDGTVLNQIEFVDPTTKRKIHLNIENTLEIGKDGRSETTTALTGVMKPYEGNYTEVKVTAMDAEASRKLVQNSLGSSIWGVINTLKDKTISVDAAKFALTAGKKIEKPSEALKTALEELAKEIGDR